MAFLAFQPEASFELFQVFIRRPRHSQPSGCSLSTPVRSTKVPKLAENRVFDLRLIPAKQLLRSAAQGSQMPTR